MADTDDARLAAAAAYRTESESNDGGERHDSLQQTAKRPMKTIEDALRSVIDECRRDKFWANMAKPAEKAIELMRFVDSATDEEAAAKTRETALLLLHHLDEQMQAATSGNMFSHEAKIVRHVVAAIDADPTLTLASPLDAAAAAAQREQAAASDQSKQNEANMSTTSQARLERVRKAMVPYTFEQALDSPEMTIKINVAAATKTSDVSVKITRTNIIVKVAGHELQPSVIDGTFLHPVDPEVLDWHFEGSGEGRTLVIDCEKKSPGLDWSQGLLAIGSS